MANFNLPDNILANDPDAPWNQPEENELPEDIQEVVNGIDAITLWVYHKYFKHGYHRFEDVTDMLADFRETLINEFME